MVKRGRIEPPVHALLLKPDGTTRRFEFDVRRRSYDQVAAILGIPSTDLEYWGTAPQGPAPNLALALDEWGLNRPDPQINRTAWWCYGGSPMFGNVALLRTCQQTGEPLAIPDVIVQRVEKREIAPALLRAMDHMVPDLDAYVAEHRMTPAQVAQQAAEGAGIVTNIGVGD